MAGAAGVDPFGKIGLILVLAGALWLPACMPVHSGWSYSGGSGYYGSPYGYGSSYGYGAPSRSYSYGGGGWQQDRSVRDLNHKGRAGLERGCATRYGSGSHRYWQCVDGERGSDKALRDGCRELFGWNKRRMQSCMSW